MIKATAYTGLLLGLGVALIALGIWSAAPNQALQVSAPHYVLDELTRPLVSAPVWLLFDIESGVPIAGVGQDTVRPIASLTKLMTASVAYQTMDMNAMTRVSLSAIETEGRSGRLILDEEISIHELLFPLLLESSNDAAEVLAETTGSEQFNTLMQERAQTLGMQSTSFEDPSGLATGNRSTARDLALFLESLYGHERHLLDIASLPQYIGENHDWLNNNPVVNEVGYLGGKHGYTPEAGQTFAGVFIETLKEGGPRNLGLILLGSDDLAKDVDALRAYANTHVRYVYDY